MRSRVALAPAASCAMLVETSEQLIDATRDGIRQRGFFPHLVEVFGAGAFDTGGHRFRDFIDSEQEGWAQCCWRLTFAREWQGMRDEFGQDAALRLGPLRLEATEAGRGRTDRMQRSLTRQREDLEFNRLNAEILARPLGDPIRLAWQNENVTSTQWVTSYPTRQRRPAAAVFRETVATYLGAESPGCRVLVDARLPSGVRVDAYGFQLDNALIGNNFKEQHDAIDRLVFVDVLRSGVQGEWQPRRLFQDCLPQDEAAREGLVPDARLRINLGLEGEHGQAERTYLLDTKTIHGGGSIYMEPASGREQCGAVKRRAAQVATDLYRKAREKDRDYNNVPIAPGNVGPVLARLQEYPPGQGVVWGQYGESSPLVEKLAQASATKLAEKRWRTIGARSLAEARGHYLGMLRRRWGCAAVFAAAEARVRKLAAVLRPRGWGGLGAAVDLDADGFEAAMGAGAFEAGEGGAGLGREALVGWGEEVGDGE